MQRRNSPVSERNGCGSYCPRSQSLRPAVQHHPGVIEHPVAKVAVSRETGVVDIFDVVALHYIYDPLNYLVVSVTLPLAGKVIEASPDRPYLCLRLDIDPAQICRLIADVSPIRVPGVRTTGRGLFLDRIDAPLLDAVLRLLRLLETPDDIAPLAPLAQQEIFYRLLRGEQGQRLHEIAIPDTQTHRISRAIEWLNNHYAEPLSIENLAQMINLSTSALHHRFKSVTAMSPLQYQKQLRLQEARPLLLLENSDVSSIGYKMGYESPSQFSREYSRLFGASPSKDIARLRAQAI